MIMHIIRNMNRNSLCIIGVGDFYLFLLYTLQFFPNVL